MLKIFGCLQRQAPCDCGKCDLTPARMSLSQIMYAHQQSLGVLLKKVLQFAKVNMYIGHNRGRWGSGAVGVGARDESTLSTLVLN